MSQQPESNCTSASRKSRQKPGAACNECRRRKLRCDGQRPQCSLCKASGASCEVVLSQNTRGPKRGYLKSLQERISTLEAKQQQSNDLSMLSSGITPIDILDNSLDDFSHTLYLPPMEEESIQNIECSRKRACSSSTNHSTNGDANTDPSPPFADNGQDLAIDSRTFKAANRSGDIVLSDFMQADLDQLYFDRIHNCTPFVHHRRYSSWKRCGTINEAKTCLQCSMWVLAASASATYQSITDSLYLYTRHALDKLESQTMSLGSTDMEEVQAWILLAIYEFMFVGFRQGWTSAGRAFRMLQLNWLPGMCTPKNTTNQQDWVKEEQENRTFWVAYCLDRFTSLRTGSALTFSEQVAVRLPAPETNFQCGSPIPTCLLSEAIDTSDQMETSHFNQVIIVATVVGRALTHRHQSMVETAHPNDMQEFWSRHYKINTTLTLGMEMFFAQYPSASHGEDEILIFVSMMWQTTIMHLYQTIDCMIPPEDDRRSIVTDQVPYLSIAASEMSKLMENLSYFGGLKVHPLMPIPLLLWAEFLASHIELGDWVSEKVQKIGEILCSLKSLNNFGQGFTIL